MNGFSACTVSYIELIDVFEYEREEFSIWVDGCAVDGRAEVTSIALL